MFVALSISCAKVPDSYRVLGYDAKSGEWVFLHHFVREGQHQTIHLTTVCAYYQRGGADNMVKGPNVCHLEIGSILVPTARPISAKIKAMNILSIGEGPDFMTITQGDGDSPTEYQGFVILKKVLVPQ